MIMNKSFQRKTIENVIRAKINKWLKSFPKEEAELVKEIRKSYIVTGGAITSMLLGEMPSDYDVYFNDASVVEKLAKYYTKDIKTTGMSPITIVNHGTSVEIKIKSAGAAGEDVDLHSYRYFEYGPEEQVQEYFANKKNNKGKFKAQFVTSNSISLSDEVQLITRFIGNPEEIHKNFDFVHVTNYYSEETGLVLKQEALEAIMTRKLKYIGSLFPISTVFRIRKFIKRGWNISAGEIFKICWDISKLDLNDTSVLKDQLTGVDVAYFGEVISIIEGNIKDRELDRTYLFEIITRVFDQEDAVEEMVINEEIYINQGTDDQG